MQNAECRIKNFKILKGLSRVSFSAYQLKRIIRIDTDDTLWAGVVTYSRANPQG